MTRDKAIAVYHDEGTGEFSRACLMYALAQAFEGRARVRRIFADEIARSDDWHEQTLLLALPGGADRPYQARLCAAGNASIARYLRQGGALLGVCAGAYYACARIRFEDGTPAAVSGARELALFCGEARGSLHDLAEPYALSHLRCAEVVPLTAAGSGATLRALYWGGPEFLPDPGARYTPLLHYLRPSGETSLAALRVEVGRGRAVLCGVHTEVRGCQFPIEVSRYGEDSFEHGMRVSRALAQAESLRQQAFALLLDALALG